MIKRFKPTHLVIIDTIDVAQKAGTIVIMDPDIVGGATFSTHTMPAAILADYLHKTTNCKTTIIGIQARSIEFGGKISKEVKSSARFVADAFIDTIKAMGNGRKKTG